MSFASAAFVSGLKVSKDVAFFPNISALIIILPHVASIRLSNTCIVASMATIWAGMNFSPSKNAAKA